MYDKFVAPGVFPIVVFIAFTIVREYGRSKNWPRWRNADMMRAVCVVFATHDYLIAWRSDIATAWIGHPEVTAFCFIVLVPLLEVPTLGAIFGKGGLQAFLAQTLPAVFPSKS